MRTLIVTAFVSLDGVMEAPGGEPGYRNSGWTFKDIKHVDEAYEIKGREQEEAAAMMMGRVSYDAFAPVWPDLDYFPQYNAMPKYVVSTTLQESDLVTNWNEINILRSMDDVAALKETDGGPIIVHGSAASRRQPRRCRPGRPLPPARLPGPARRRQAPVQQHRQGQADADGGRERVLLQRPAEAGVRRRQVTPRCPSAPAAGLDQSESFTRREPFPPSGATVSS